MTHMITVVIRTTAGISNPTESNSYQAQVEFGTNDFTDVVGMFVPRVVGLDEEDGGRGDDAHRDRQGLQERHLRNLLAGRNDSGDVGP